ncbi:MAG: hypothetical protein OTI36_03255, partial [Beijerinckiaceae bacterium]|nr:hypothetical protein [Beijerinckiaceae bacterium]
VLDADHPDKGVSFAGRNTQCWNEHLLTAAQGITAQLLLNSRLYLKSIGSNDIAPVCDSRAIRVYQVVRAIVGRIGPRH